MQLEHSFALSRLYRCHSQEMHRKCDITEFHLGSVHNSIQMNEGTLCMSFLSKHHHQDSTSSIDHDTGNCPNLTVLLCLDCISPEV